MAYVQALMSAFTRGDTAVLKARGRSISTAVDASEIFRRMLDTVKVVDVQIGTVELEGEDNRKRNVSTIEITVTKKA